MVFSLPDNLYSTDPNFTTLFRLLDDLDSYSREVQSDEKQQGPPARHGRYGRGLYHKCDIRETQDNYELYGEVPGMDRKDIHIELSDTNQLLIRGHAERGYDSPPPASKKATVTDEKVENGGPKKTNTSGKEEKEKKAGETGTIRFLAEGETGRQLCPRVRLPRPAVRV